MNNIGEIKAGHQLMTIELYPWELNRIDDYIVFITKYEKTGTWYISCVEERRDDFDSSRMPITRTQKIIKFILNRNNNQDIPLNEFEEEVEKFKKDKEFVRVEISSDKIVVLVYDIGE